MLSLDYVDFQHLHTYIICVHIIAILCKCKILYKRPRKVKNLVHMLSPASFKMVAQCPLYRHYNKNSPPSSICGLFYYYKMSPIVIFGK